MDTKREVPPYLKIALELGPLLVFFVAYAYFGFFAATGVFMAAVLASIAVSFAITRSVPVVTVVSAVLVLVLGALTLTFRNESFIKMKPTAIYALIGILLLGSTFFRRPFTSYVLGHAFHLAPEGWRKLTIRLSLFFIAIAVMNEIVWRTQSTDVWVNFKVLAILPLIMVFMLLQQPLIRRYAIEADT